MSKVVIRQDELRFMHMLVIGKINILDANNKSFEGDFDKMEQCVREYRMAQDVKGRLQKAIENESPPISEGSFEHISDTINPNANK